VKRRLHLRRELLLPLALACVVAAAFLAALAIDVARWRTSLPADDIEFRVGAPSAQLWGQSPVAPFRAAERLLAIENDLAFRRMLRDLRASKLRDPTVSDPYLALRRTATTDELESIVVHDPDPVLKSRASTLLGVLSIAAWNSTPPQGTSAQDRSELLLSAIASFEQAIALDPENDDAKYNLQLMLLRGSGLIPTESAAGKNPLPGGRGSRGAGAGAPGAGY
jgi:hypothetical protein